MRMNDDATLLRDYAEHGSETAFTTLVRRHVDLVYHSALRRTGGDAHRAADVAQQVFTQLARHAGKLSHHTVLSAWLHTATRNAALNLMISDQRRKAREAAAAENVLAERASASSLAWEDLRPLLDSAIDELPEADRAAIVLRFLEHRGFADIGAALRVSTDAARVRTDRALEKLRTALARRGITSTAAALGAIVASQPVLSAPAGLAATLATHSLAATASGALAFSFVSLMTTKIITTAAICGLAAFFAGNHFGSTRAAREIAAMPVVDPAAGEKTRTIAALRADNERLSADLSSLNSEIGRLKEQNATLAAQQPAPATPPTPRPLTIGLARWEIQQAALNNLRQIDAARKQFQLEKGQFAGSVQELVGRKAYIKTMRTVAGEDYSQVSMNPAEPMTVKTPDGIEVTFDPSGAATTKPEVPPEVTRAMELGKQMQAPINQALNAYRAANNGNNPRNEQALVPYFATAKDGADFVELLEAKKAAGL